MEDKKVLSQLIRMSRMSEIGELVPGMAHDINNPLTVLKGVMERIEDKVNEPDMEDTPIEDLLDMQDRACDKIIKIINTARYYAKGSDDEIDAITVNNLIDETMKLYEYPIKKKNSEIVMNLDKENPAINVNATQFQQIVVSLLSNTKDALPEKDGKVTITTRQDGKKVFVEIEDNGEGMDPDELKKAFELFSTTKEDHAGIGLNVAKELVSKLKGEFVVTSEKGVGTKASFSLAKA